MLIVSTISRFETINNRLLAPFFIPCFFTISFYLVSLQQFVKTRGNKIIFLSLSAAFIIPTFYNYVHKDLATINENKQGGIGGYTDDDWYINSGLLNHLQVNTSFFKNSRPIYSNAAHAVYFRTKQHVQILPERKYVNLVEVFNQLPSQILIWFNNEDNPEVLTIDEILKYKNLQIISKFNDGVIYECTSK